MSTVSTKTKCNNVIDIQTPNLRAHSIITKCECKILLSNIVTITAASITQNYTYLFLQVLTMQVSNGKMTINLHCLMPYFLCDISRFSKDAQCIKSRQRPKLTRPKTMVIITEFQQLIFSRARRKPIEKGGLNVYLLYFMISETHKIYRPERTKHLPCTRYNSDIN